MQREHVQKIRTLLVQGKHYKWTNFSGITHVMKNTQSSILSCTRTYRNGNIAVSSSRTNLLSQVKRWIALSNTEQVSSIALMRLLICSDATTLHSPRHLHSWFVLRYRP